MSQIAIGPISIEALFTLLAISAVVIGVSFWLHKKKQRRLREQFFAQFETSQLRMSPYKIGIVYRVVSTGENIVTIVPIWNGRSAIKDGKEFQISPDELIPFDETRFF